MRRTISREEVFKLISEVRLACAPSGISDLLEDYHQDPGQPEVGLPLALAEYYLGVRNGHLSDIYQALTGARVEVVGDEGTLLSCPCCGYRTLTERFNPKAGTGFDICRYCNWEDDGTLEAESYSSPNRGSMRDYRKRLIEQGNFFRRGRWDRESPQTR